jgi:hypothetical protein
MQTMTKVTDEIAPDRTAEVRIPSRARNGHLKSLPLSKNEIHTQFQKKGTKSSMSQLAKVDN